MPDRCSSPLVGLDTRYPLPTSISSLPGRSPRGRRQRRNTMKRLAKLFAAAAFAMTASAAAAQTYPDRTITIVVPFAAGGPTDTVTRLVAEAMSKDLGQQIVVENVGGAGGTLGAARVASAEPDGYTLLVHHI